MMERYRSSIITALTVGVVATVLPRFLSSYYVGLLTLVLIFALFAMSLDLLLGYTGLPSMGHAAFFGMGGYFAGILSVQWVHNFWITLASGLFAAALCAAVLGFIVLRAKSHYFLIITLAAAQMIWAIAFKWRTVTGGSDGFSGISRPRLGSIGVDLNVAINYYYFVLIFVGVAAILLVLIIHSPFGYVLRGIRESERRMTSLGYDVWFYKYLAFIIAGVFAGLAGIFHVYYNGYVGPGELDVVRSTEAMLMVVLGGAGTLFGPALGAVVIVLLSHVVSASTGRWVLVLGLMYVLVVVCFPDGIYDPLKRCARKYLFK